MKEKPSAAARGDNPVQQDVLGAECWTAAKEKGLESVVSSKLSVSKECTRATKAANSFLGSIRKSTASGSREVILPLYSALMRSQLEISAQLWAP